MKCEQYNEITDRRDKRTRFSHVYHNYCGEKCPDNNCNPLATNEQFYPWKTKEGAATKLSI